jgi:hypothetical protein
MRVPEHAFGTVSNCSGCGSYSFSDVLASGLVWRANGLYLWACDGGVWDIEHPVDTHAEVDIPNSGRSEHWGISLSLAVASEGGFVVRTDVGFDFGDGACFDCATSLNHDIFAKQLSCNGHGVSVEEVQRKNFRSHENEILVCALQ